MPAGAFAFPYPSRFFRQVDLMDRCRTDFRQAIDRMAARMRQAARVGEAAAAQIQVAATPAPDERLAQCIWFDSLFLHDDLRTDSGMSLEIVQAGRWNDQDGPDFRDAHLRIDGKSLRGDIEIHLHSQGWRQHRHHLNPAYDGVILHAYLWREDSPAPARNSGGEAIEGFCMEPVLFPDLETIRQTVQIEDYPYQTPSAIGRCQPLMCSLEEDFVRELLESAGRERIERKARRFDDQSLGETLEQVFYQALMTSMGHKANKGLFFLLSKRAPLCEMADYLRDVGRDRAVAFAQAVLLNVARLVPESAEECDAESAAYLERIDALWRNFRGYFSDRLIPPTRQWITGVRPVNFAHRRMAGVAHLLDRLFFEEDLLDRFLRRIRCFDASAKPSARRRWIREELVGPFVVESPEDFWTHRYTFTSKRAARGMKLIGESRAASLAFNALLPILLLETRRRKDLDLEDKVWQVLEAYPALETNAIVRHMRMRLFGDDRRGEALLDTELRRQGLFQIFATCCNHNETGCEECYYQRVHL